MEDFLAFRKMITPVIIQIVFWIGTILSVIVGILVMIGGAFWGSTGLSILVGICIIILGPLCVRIWCELLILFFRMNETLTEIKNNIKK